MIEIKDEEILLEGFREYLRNRGLKETSVKDDLSRINMMKSRNIDYRKGEEYVREFLNDCSLRGTTPTSCLRVCRYYKDYLDHRDEQ